MHLNYAFAHIGTDNLATRAARTIIDWAVDTRGVHRVEWHTKTGNQASIEVARRLGMTREGVLREAMLHRGRRWDLEVWSVLAPEWRAATRRT
jgi:RimJ/RimL family protein N-acetyltransferase